MDKATLEVVRHSLLYISEEMGVALKKSAYSPNIRERMDHSCALFDSHGRLVGQAEHIPVHIGSLPLGLKNTLEFVAREGVELNEGDMLVLNDPYIAGTHLNDFMVVRPVFLNGRLIGYTANKAHHVDIGGIVPASISIDARELFQEGVIIPPVKLMENDKLNEDIVRLIERNTRMPKTSLGDLRAQIASARLGEKRLKELVSGVGINEFEGYVDAILSETERFARVSYEAVSPSKCEGEDYLELDDRLLNISIKLSVDGGRIEADFSGTACQVDVPLNAVLGVTVAAVSYAVKSLLCPDITLNEGFIKTLSVSAPEGTLVNPIKPAPVAAGNLETSQRIVDVVFRALSSVIPERVPAASTGSMNSVMLGGVDPSRGLTWAFYETIGGGQGARPNKDGVDGVHVNMTNTLNTSIEVIERYYPVRIVSYMLRDRSGGKGKWRGGLGIERSYEALATLKASVIGDREKVAPWGLAGGHPGSCAEYLVIRSDGKVERMSSKFSVALKPGDKLIVRTAGGGGYGDPSERDEQLQERDRQYGYMD